MPASLGNRTAFAALMGPEFWEVYEMTGKARPTEYTTVANTKELPWNPVTDIQVAGLSTVPAMPEGQAYTLDAPVVENQLSVLATPFGLAVEFTYPAWEDEQYGVFRDMSKELQRSAQNREEVTFWALFNNAFSGSYPGFDGQSLCSTSHNSNNGSGVQANRPSPDVGFSMTGLEGSVLRYHGILNDRGLPQLTFGSMVILGPANIFAAREILGSSNRPYTADNETNALRPEDFSVMISHYLTTATNWFLIANKGEHDLNFGWRTHTELDSFDDPWTKNAVFAIYMRIVAWFGDWRGVDGSTG